MKKGFATASGHKTLKLAISQEWIDRIDWFFACWWCNFRKTKSYFYRFWVGLVENGYCILCHGALKSAISQEWIDELNWVLSADGDAIVFS